ncbi:MAG TPA: phage tail protein [Enhygromyxa sp.]|nr:phage tail protein [Enhygromyxa sp.]
MADANGLRFWLLASEHDWTALPSAEGQPPPHYDEQRRSFTLGRYARFAFTELPAEAAIRWALARTVSDAHGTFAFFDSVSGEVHGTGSAAGTVAIHTPSVAPTDMTVGGDGVLYLIEGNEVVLVDLRDRWDSVRLSVTGFTPSRIASAGDAGVWILDRTHRRLALVRGRPLPRRGLRVRAPDVFDPHEENPDPPRIDVLPAAIDATEDPIEIAISDGGRVAVLLWRGVDQAAVRFVAPDGAVSAALVLGEIERPYSLGWIDDDTLAVLVVVSNPEDSSLASISHVVTYLADPADEELTRPPLGGVYPLPGHDGAPFARTVSSPPRYAAAPAPTGERFAPRKLVQVSATFRAPGGELRLDDDAPLDSGQIGFVWHRAYLEADLPAACGVRLLVGASDDFGEPPQEFFEHVFGDVQGELAAKQPRAVWSTQASELPFHPGLLHCPIVPHRSGLFSVLLQRSTRRVSAVSGRYLWVRLLLEGNGQRTPEIAALRVYGSRFSYVQRYLPRVFHEQLVAPEADMLLSEGPRSEADFLERFLCNFEGVLTPLEDRIANAHMLTDPSTVPTDALDWLGSWIGFVFDPAYPSEHRREALRNAMTLHQWRGSHRGLQMAIDILTGGRIVDGQMVGGAVTNGQVVLLEGWRLRRTFATLLGVDLADENDPLLVGVTRSGNSRVGDSLILAQEHRAEFLALLRRTMPGDGPPAGAGIDEWITWYIEELVDQFAVRPFFDELAYRLVVLVHEDLDGELVALIERVAELEAPVHLVTEVAKATYPFMVGLASLVGVDTYLRAPAPKPKITVEQSRLGAGFLSRPAALDPRLEGGP